MSTDIATVSVLIGNTDDRLPQRQWSRFVTLTDASVSAHAGDRHFSGYSPSDASWQNACWVFDIARATLPMLDEELQTLCRMFDQDSIAVVEGSTRFVERQRT